MWAVPGIAAHYREELGNPTLRPCIVCAPVPAANKANERISDVIGALKKPNLRLWVAQSTVVRRRKPKSDNKLDPSFSVPAFANPAYAGCALCDAAKIGPANSGPSFSALPIHAHCTV